MQDGHTLVIGGLISESTNKTSTGIPLLSQIPVLGALFGSTTNKKTRQELIVMVTPHVVGNSEEADALTEEYTKKMKSLKKKIEERVKRAEKKEKVDEVNIHSMSR